MTAVEFYRKHLHALVSTGKTEYKTEAEIFEAAKEMEKEQIEKAYVYGAAYGIDISNNLSPDMYYNQTFKSE